MDVSVPLIDDSDDVMLLRVLSILVIPALMLLTALLNDVNDDVMLISDDSILARAVDRPLTCEVMPLIEPVTFNGSDATNTYGVVVAFTSCTS